MVDPSEPTVIDAKPATIWPTPVTNLHMTAIDTGSLSLAWTAPMRGSGTIRYTVFIRKAGAGWWSIAAETVNTRAHISGLKPKVAYDIEVMADNT